jgi:rhodanese-related sulfurtransferase
MNVYQSLLLIAVMLIIALKIRKMYSSKDIPKLAPLQVAEKMKNSLNVVLIDVRTEAERNAGFIKSSVHIPLNELNSRLKELEKYKDKEIICYCHSGSRSSAAAIILSKSGFRVSNMAGGISAWNSAGLK